MHDTNGGLTPQERAVVRRMVVVSVIAWGFCLAGSGVALLMLRALPSGA